MFELVSIGLWLWLSIIAFFSILVFCTEILDNGKAATSVTILALIAIWFMFDVNLFTWILHNPVEFILYFGFYSVIGVFWGITKWNFYLSRKKAEYARVTTRFMERQKIQDRSMLKKNGKFRSEFEKYLHSYYGSIQPEIIFPTAGDKKADITMWIFYWIPSLFWTVTGKFFRWVGENLYEMISNFVIQLRLRKLSSELSEIDG